MLSILCTYHTFPCNTLIYQLEYPAWDDNWDGHESSSNPLENGITRHIILIRHGQYDETHDEENDAKRVLTPLGRRQARLTGKRIAEMIHGYGTLYRPCRVATLTSSNMTRAKETADIISRFLPKTVERAEPDPLLNEGIPAQVIPTRPELDILTDWNKNGKRIEQAFQKYIVRNTKEVEVLDAPESNQHSTSNDVPVIDQQHEFQIIVCHGNVIRYFFCRALQLPPEAWLRLSTYNCSLTYLMIRPNGRVSCRMMGDIGHLGYSKSSFSMHHGFVP